MRRTTITLALALASSFLSIAVVDACGDKLLRIGRGARFQHSLHTASVIIFLPADAPPEASKNAPKLQAFLKKPGHKANVVQGPERLSQVLGSGRYDVVLTALSDVATVQRQSETSTVKPVIVPMLFNAKKSDIAAVKKQYRAVVKDPNDGDEYLDAIETALRSRRS